MYRRVGLLGTLLLHVACNLFVIFPAPCAPVRQDLDDLTREMAEFRRAQIKSVAYGFDVALREKAETFDGTARLQVQLNDTSAPLSIDLKARELHSVRVDGKAVQQLVKRDGSFDIPVEYLSLEPLEIVVTYTGDYSKSGEGLCYFIDPVDDKEYLYTNLEPYGAHLVVPCFDQPDIKATFSMTVDAPKTWVVIGNMPVASQSTAGDSQQVTFQPTPPLSTYLFFLGAGGYQSWHDEHHGLPLALYARASLVKHFDPERLFAETKAGLDYFNAFFQFPYPFAKYDHVFVPELNPGAMENAGAVTMNEYMIFRGAATAENYRDRNNTLLHEMAHMWFGDLVTMAWWNDLWLNESFATFSAFLAQDTMTKDPAIWQDFYGMKGWAYYQDQLSTTHPIETEVPSARLAMDNFDGITYAKGASALKQLWFQVGGEAYRAGVAAYFKEHAWKNATRSQFMDAIALASGADLLAWTETWLKTEGLAQISVDLDCTDGKIASFAIEHAPVNAPRLSPHKTQVALFQMNDRGILEQREIIPVAYAGERTDVRELAGPPCPDFVYPNYGDMDYGLFFLDPHSYDTIVTRLAALEDPFLRRMVWGTLSTMVRHERLRASEFMKLILDNLPAEADQGVLEYLLGGRMINETLFQHLTPEERPEFASRLMEILIEGRGRAAGGSDAWLLWHDALVSLSCTPHVIDLLRPMLDDDALDQPRRWNIVSRLAVLGAKDTEALVETELNRDPTDQGKRAAFGIRGAIPTPEAKAAQWERLADADLSLSLQRAGSGSFHSSLYPELSEPYVDRWFEAVRTMDWDAEQHRIGVWFDNLFPPIYTSEFLERSKRELADAKLPPRAHRAWQESNDQIERVIAIRSYNRRSKNTP